MPGVSGVSVRLGVPGVPGVPLAPGTLVCCCAFGICLHPVLGVPDVAVEPVVPDVLGALGAAGVRGVPGVSGVSGVCCAWCV